MNVDVPDLAACSTIDQHCLGEGEEVGRLVFLGVDAEPLHPHFQQVIRLVFVGGRTRAEITARTLDGAVCKDSRKIDSSCGAIEARSRPTTFALARDIGCTADHSLERVL